jgi:hypothetical protein
LRVPLHGLLSRCSGNKGSEEPDDHRFERPVSDYSSGALDLLAEPSFSSSLQTGSCYQDPVCVLVLPGQSVQLEEAYQALQPVVQAIEVVLALVGVGQLRANPFELREITRDTR